MTCTASLTREMSEPVRWCTRPARWIAKVRTGTGGAAYCHDHLRGARKAGAVVEYRPAPKAKREY